LQAQKLDISYNRRMETKESEKLIAQLRAWCQDGYGRQAQVAEALGVSRAAVTDWLKGNAIPGYDTGMALQAFLKKARRAKSRARAL
jgi:transcriptional regulator with XRE-family HTH domain